MRTAGRQNPVPAIAARQRGAALLVALLVLILAAAAMFSRDVARRVGKASHDDEVAAAMQLAKDALLGYALTFGDRNPGEYGFLPCPDLDASGDEGAADAAGCGPADQSVLGRVPWRTLGLAPRPADTRDCLWLAVSGGYKNGANKTAMLNADTRGLFEVFAQDASTYLAGPAPADRAVAVLIAPGAVLAGQNRTPAAGTAQCGGNYAANGYLDAVGGIDNAVVAPSPDVIDRFAIGPEPGANDRVLTITRREIADAYYARADFVQSLTDLATAVAGCVADYGLKNPGGATDLRLPWPAPVNLTDYRVAAEYDDTPVGELSGRVPDGVNDSNLQTGNPVANVLSDCDSIAVPTWTPTMALMWQHWKDHLFYAVADGFKPDAVPPIACGTCLSVDGTATLAGIVMLAGPALPAPGQVRDASPIDPDTRSSISNYVEGRNASNHPNVGGGADYETGTAGPTFNDVLICIDDDLSVFPCTDAAGH
ncbi:MAG: hypothetical protein ACR2QV_03755 [Gammaproteobacteria bacterium]